MLILLGFQGLGKSMIIRQTYSLLQRCEIHLLCFFKLSLRYVHLAGHSAIFFTYFQESHTPKYTIELSKNKKIDLID